MSLLTAETIRDLTINHNLITRPDYNSDEEWQERVDFIEGSQFDLTLDTIFLPVLKRFTPFIGRYSRETPGLEEVESAYSPVRKEEIWKLAPGYYIGTTGETVSLPFWMKGLLGARTSCFMCGVIPEVTFVNPEFSGLLRFGLDVHNYVEIGKGARVITLNFDIFDLFQKYDEKYLLELTKHGDKVQPYKGIWTGSKVSTEGVERPH